MSGRLVHRLGRVEAIVEPFVPPRDEPGAVLEEWLAWGRLIDRFIDTERPQHGDEQALSAPRRGRPSEPLPFLEAWGRESFEGWIDSSRSAVLAMAASRVAYEWRLAPLARRYFAVLIQASAGRGFDLAAAASQRSRSRVRTATFAGSMAARRAIR